MSNQLLSSKITIEEEEPGIHQIEGIVVGVAGFVGVTERGPFTSQLLTGKEEYSKLFGGYHGSGEVAQAVDGFFSNGGSQCYVQRTVKYSNYTTATRTSVAASLTNIKTDTVAASGAYVQGSVAGPWELANSDTLDITTDLGGPTTATVTATAADEESGNAETYDLADSLTLTVKVDQGSVQTITFLTSEFVSIAAATAEEVAAVINAKISGARATVTTAGTKVTITSDKVGTGSYLEITGGTANTGGVNRLNFATAETQGTGNVVDVSVVTAAELETIIEAVVAGVAVTEEAGGYLRITRSTPGASYTVQVAASSSADDEIGFDNAVHSGLDAQQVDTLGVAAKTEGAYGNTISITIEAATSGDADRFNLVVLDGTVILETWPNLSMDDTDNDFVETIVNDADNGSWYITVTDLDAGVGTPTLDRPLNGTYGPMTSGNDGLSGIDSADYLGASVGAGRFGLRGLDEVQDLSMIAIPGQTSSAVQNGMIAYCEVQRSGAVFAILDPPANTGATGMVTHVVNNGLLNATEFAAIFWPRIEVVNPSKTVFGSSSTIYVAPSGYVAGVFARQDTSAEGGIYQAAAGVEHGVVFGCLGFETNETELEEKRDLVYPKRINPITFLRGRPRFIDGSRTLKGGGNFPSIPERRGVIFIEQSIKNGLQWARHKNNDEALRARVSRSVTAFLNTQMRVSAFRTKNPATAYFVDFGDALNPIEAVFAGKLYGRIGLATQKPAEFIILRFAQDTRAFTEANA
jgi:hypothetical protein